MHGRRLATWQELAESSLTAAQLREQGIWLPMGGGAPAGPGVAPGSPGGPAAAGTANLPVVPFDQAAHVGIEPGPVFTFTPGAATQVSGPNPLPAQGYLRRIILEVSSSGGSAGAGVLAADAPFNILNLVRLQDTNGAPLVELSGYNLMLANTYGAYSGSPDPRTDPDYSTSVAAPAFQLSIPVQIGENGLGALANQSAAAAYRLTLIGETNTAIWSTQPTTVPAITVRTFCEYWTLPAPADMLGRRQQQVPPFNGTAQYWTQQPNISVAAGGNNTRVTRVGNLIRTLIFVARISGARSDTAATAPFPDPYILNWDARDLQIASAKTRRKVMRELISQLSTRDTGVYAFIFSDGEDRNAGALQINKWLPTVTATRLELDGTSAGAGTLDILVNDVSVAETSPAARAVETSATGYHPPVAPLVMGAQ